MMRKRLAWIVLFLLALPPLLWAEGEKFTTVILTRHAEKQVNAGDNPDLSPAGEARARELVRLLSASGIRAVYYCHDHLRTRKTAEPLARSLKLAGATVDADKTDVLVRDIFAHHSGEVVFVAGHSDTVPAIIQALGAKVPAIADAEYDNLYIVTASSPGTASVVRLKYGNPSK